MNDTAKSAHVVRHLESDDISCGTGQETLPVSNRCHRSLPLDSRRQVGEVSVST